MREQYMRTGEGFVVCYSVTDRRTFDEATAYKRLIDRVRNSDDVPIVLVGNKCDLQLERQVRVSLTVIEMQARLRLCTSLTHINNVLVLNIFSILNLEVIHHRNLLRDNFNSPPL